MGSSVVCKAGGILFGQYSSGRGVAVRYITRFELDGAASSPLPVGNSALLCVYRSSRSWKIKCHSWRHFSFWISAVPSASSLCVSHCITNNSFGPGSAACSLDQKCQFSLSNGLAPSTRRVYRSAQRQFINFCTLDGYVSSNGSLLPTNEQTLLRCCSHLADRFDHSSIRGLSLGDTVLAHRSGFPRSLGELPPTSPSSPGHLAPSRLILPQRQPVTADLMRIIQLSLDTHNSEHVMLWAACCLGFFGFLRAEEFTVNSTFDPSILLTVQDLQVDVEVNPSSLRVCIKSSKTDPFARDVFIYLGRG